MKAVVCQRCKSVLGLASSEKHALELVALHESSCAGRSPEIPVWCGHCARLSGVAHSLDEVEQIKTAHAITWHGGLQPTQAGARA